MAPDLNSLPPSNTNIDSAFTNPSAARAMTAVNPSGIEALRGQSPSPLSRTTSTSLQAAAAVNAGLQIEDGARRSSNSSGSMPQSRSSPTGRRRSTVLMNLQMNNPNQPGPGEMVNENIPGSFRVSRRGSASASPIAGLGDPHHQRNPSLGEIHQVMEQEEEAHVNRLLQQIRAQQVELQQLRLHNSQLRGDSDSSLPAIDDALITPNSEVGRTHSLSHSIPAPVSSAAQNPRSPSFNNPRSSHDLVRQDISRRSRTPSRTASPRIRTASIAGEADPFALGSRDEGAFYQAETSMMTRENQMLKQRIRELERQLAETGPVSAHEPAHHTHLFHSESISEDQPSTSANEA